MKFGQQDTDAILLSRSRILLTKNCWKIGGWHAVQRSVPSAN